MRNAIDAFGRGIDAAFEFVDADIDYRAIEGAPDDVGVLRGHDAYRHHLEQWMETFDDFRAELEELMDAGDRVVAVQRLTARMKGSEADVSLRYAVVYTVRDGKIDRIREYATREEALEAAGLAASAPGQLD